MEIIGDAEGLKREILEMARREGAGIISAAGDEAARILAAAGEEAAKAGAALLEAARVEAARRRAMLLASVPAETARLRGARLESLLGSIRTEAARLLPSEAAASGKAGLLAALAAQAVLGMEGNKFTLAIAPEDKEAAEGLPAEIERKAARGPLEIKTEADPAAGGGVLVRGSDGRQYWDNSLGGRLERVWPQLRLDLGRRLESGGGEL